MIELTPGQGSALSGLFTSLGAILAIIIAGRYFSGKVKSLSEALDKSQSMLEVHAEHVRTTLAAVTAEVNVLKDSVSSIGEQSSRIESNTITIEENSVSSMDNVAQENFVEWEEFRDAWYQVRDRLEGIANSESLDGRRRAAYGRIDRRSYYDLIERMQKDGVLTGYSALMFQNALEIWHTYKNGRKRINADDLKKLKALGDTPAKASP